MHIQIEISYEIVLLTSGAHRTAPCVLSNLSETQHLHYACWALF